MKGPSKLKWYLNNCIKIKSLKVKIQICNILNTEL